MGEAVGLAVEDVVGLAVGDTVGEAAGDSVVPVPVPPVPVSPVPVGPQALRKADKPISETNSATILFIISP